MNENKFFKVFLRTRDFLFLEKRKKNLYRGYILVRQKMGKTSIEIFEDESSM